ncbi:MULTISPECIES: ribonuclease H family protein [unclassified Brevibacterium]|uniref:ribonuclease H family protein n=1 Tax=unclassified Brevibacterium TaxID=2614124 RepID=UPI0008A33E93|nr:MULTISPECIES: ribonuclease H [unclassified Brevibacterium]OFL64153.1 ribonuclease H [Brevibacterium sp. HMSC063G07]
MTIIAAVDGSALGNPGPAGWAWYISDDQWACGGWPKATNNRGELQAVIELLRAVEDSGADVHVLCDSQYAINSITKWMTGWKKRGWKKANGSPVLNDDLMKQLDELMSAAKSAGRSITYEWVKGHANHRMNERADDLARAAAGAYQKGAKLDSGPGYSGEAANEPDTAGSGTAESSSSGTSSSEDRSTAASTTDTVRIWADVPRDLAGAIAERAREDGVRPQQYLRALIEKAVAE